MSPIEAAIEKVLTPVEKSLKIMGDGEMPYTTHEGVLDIAGKKLRCYKLNTGETIFNADDVEGFFNNGIDLGKAFDKLKESL